MNKINLFKTKADFQVENYPIVAATAKKISTSNISKFPYYKMRSLLFQLGLTDEKGFPVKELEELPFPPLEKSEIKALENILETPIQHSDPVTKIFFKTTLRKVESALNSELIILKLLACGSRPLKEVLPHLTTRLLKAAYYHVHGKKLEITPEIEEVLAQYFKIFCIETDTDIQNYYLNPILKAHRCLLNHLAHSSEKKPTIKVSELTKKENGVFEKLHAPNPEDINQFAIHSFRQSKVEILHVKNIKVSAVTTQETFRFDLFPLFKDSKEFDLYPECLLSNHWMALFDILQGIMSHVSRHGLFPDGMGHIDIMRILGGYAKGQSFREPDMIPELIEACMKGQVTTKKKKEIYFSNEIKKYYHSHLPDSPNSAAALIWKFLILFHGHSKLSEKSLKGIVRHTEKQWRGSKLDHLFDYMLSSSPEPFQTAFALFDITVWHHLHNNDPFLGPIPSETDDSGFDILVSLNQEERAMIAHTPSLQKSLEFLNSHPDSLSHVFSYLPRVAKYVPSNYSHLSFPAIDLTALFSSENENVRRISLITFLIQQKYKGIHPISEAQFFNVCFSLNLSLKELRNIETYGSKEGFFQPWIKAKKNKGSEAFAKASILSDLPKFIVLCERYLKEAASELDRVNIEDYIKLIVKIRGSRDPATIEWLNEYCHRIKQKQMYALLQTAVKVIPEGDIPLWITTIIEQMKYAPTPKCVAFIANYMASLAEKGKVDLAQSIYLYPSTKMIWMSLESTLGLAEAAAFLFKSEYLKPAPDIKYLEHLRVDIQPSIRDTKFSGRLKKILKEIGLLQAQYIENHPEEINESLSPIHRFCLSRRQALYFQFKFLKSHIREGHFERAESILKKRKELSQSEAQTLLNLAKQVIEKKPETYGTWLDSNLIARLERDAGDSLFSFKLSLLENSDNNRLWKEVLSDVKNKPELLTEKILQMFFSKFEQETLPNNIIEQFKKLIPIILDFCSENELIEIAFDILDGFLCHAGSLSLPFKSHLFAMRCCLKRANTYPIQAETVLNGLKPSQHQKIQDEAGNITALIAQNYSSASPIRSLNYFKKAYKFNPLLADQISDQINVILSNLIRYQHPMALKKSLEFINLFKSHPAKVKALGKTVADSWIPQHSKQKPNDIRLIQSLLNHPLLKENQKLCQLALILLDQTVQDMEEIEVSERHAYCHLFYRCFTTLDNDFLLENNGNSPYMFLRYIKHDQPSLLLWTLDNFPLLSKNLSDVKKYTIFFDIAVKSLVNREFSKTNHKNKISDALLNAYSKIEPLLEANNEQTTVISIQLVIVPLLLVTHDYGNYKKALDIVEHAFSDSQKQEKELNTVANLVTAPIPLCKVSIDMIQKEINRLREFKLDAANHLLNSQFLHPKRSNTRSDLIRICRSFMSHSLPLNLLIRLLKKLTPLKDPEAVEEKLKLVEKIIQKQPLNKKCQAPRDVDELIKNVLQEALSLDTPLKSMYELSGITHVLSYLIKHRELFVAYIYSLIRTHESEFLVNARDLTTSQFGDTKHFVDERIELINAIDIVESKIAEKPKLLSDALTNYVQLLYQKKYDHRSICIHEIALPEITSSLLDFHELSFYKLFIQTAFDSETYNPEFFIKKLPWLLSEVLKHKNKTKLLEDPNYHIVFKILFTQAISYIRKFGYGHPSLNESIVKLLILIANEESLVADIDLSECHTLFLSDGNPDRSLAEQIKIILCLIDGTLPTFNDRHSPANLIIIIRMLLTLNTTKSRAFGLLLLGANFEILTIQYSHQYPNFCRLMNFCLNRQPPKHFTKALSSLVSNIYTEEQQKLFTIRLLHILRDILSITPSKESPTTQSAYLISNYISLLTSNLIDIDFHQDVFVEHIGFALETVNQSKSCHSHAKYSISLNPNLITKISKLLFPVLKQRDRFHDSDLAIINNIVQSLVSGQNSIELCHKHLKEIYQLLHSVHLSDGCHDIIFQIESYMRRSERFENIGERQTELLHRLIFQYLQQRSVFSFSQAMLLITDFTNVADESHIDFNRIYDQLAQTFDYPECLTIEIQRLLQKYFLNLLNHLKSKESENYLKFISQLLQNILSLLQIDYDNDKKNTIAVNNFLTAFFNSGFQSLREELVPDLYEDYFTLWEKHLLLIAKYKDIEALKQVFDELLDHNAFKKYDLSYKQMLIQAFFKPAAVIYSYSREYEKVCISYRIKLQALPIRTHCSVPNWKNMIDNALIII